jgi:hypothetical protein
MFIDSSKKTNVFYIWGIFSTGNVKGIMQMTMGVDFAEQEWLNEEVTKHIFSLKTKYFRSSVMQDNLELIKGIPALCF